MDCDPGSGSLCRESSYCIHMSCINHRVSSSHSLLLVLDSHSRCLDETVENNEANYSQNDK